MGLTISEEQERDLRASCAWDEEPGGRDRFALCLWTRDDGAAALAEIDALRERVKTLEEMLERACDFLESENLNADELRAPLKEADRG